MEFNTIPEIIEDVRNGKMVILVDDEDRENEGDLILAAEFATPQNINFMVKEARGLVCLCLTAQQVDRL
ncbi:3,4-dihydroxy-2-butanone-4-phosphate synthase, partial [Bdellovibrio sp.]